jgi:hypothetical protein
MIDLTQKIDNYQYSYRRLRAVWIRACPNLNFSDHWTTLVVNPMPSESAPNTNGTEKRSP